jgi:hypothetical protein
VLRTDGRNAACAGARINAKRADFPSLTAFLDDADYSTQNPRGSIGGRGVRTCKDRATALLVAHKKGAML